MPQEGYIMAPDESLIPFYADKLTDEIRNKTTFFCRCRQRITANIPKTKGRKPYYSSKANSCHSPDCPYYHNHILEEVIQRIDPTGKNIHSLEELLNGITAGGNIPEPRGERETSLAAPADVPPPPEDTRLVVKKKDKPSKLIDLYELLKNPDIETYASHDPKQLIIDRQSLSEFETKDDLLGVKVAVLKRCGQRSDHIKNWMFANGIFRRTLILRAPADYPLFLEPYMPDPMWEYPDYTDYKIFYALVFSNQIEQDKAFKKMNHYPKEDDPTFLAIAKWTEYQIFNIRKPYALLLVGHIGRQSQFVFLPPDRNHDQ